VDERVRVEMKRLYGISSWLVALGSALSARADLVPLTGRAADAGDRATRSVHATPSALSLTEEQALALAQAATPADLPLAAPNIRNDDAHGATGVMTVPPLPDSAALVLWAFGTLGAWQLGRMSRHLHAVIVPEWYHAGGPAQIGHAKPLDWHAASQELAVCQLDRPARVRGLSPPGIREVSIPRPNDAYRIVAIPRGPPCPAERF